MKIICIAIISLVIASCQSKITSTPIVKIVQYEELLNLIEEENDQVYVVNFWATWCKPCIEEIPDFMEVNEEFKNNKNFKMILVSLDRVKDFETVMKPFLQKNTITTDVYLLDDNKRMNTWIPIFDSKWSGAIPATFIYKNGKKMVFKEKSLSKTELKKLINEVL